MFKTRHSLSDFRPVRNLHPVGNELKGSEQPFPASGRGKYPRRREEALEPLAGEVLLAEGDQILQGLAKN